MKPGYATTEFWLTVIVAIFGLAMSQGWLGTSFPQEQVVGILAMFLPVVIYSISRAITKWGFFKDWQKDPNL